MTQVLEVKAGLLRVSVPDGFYTVTLTKPKKPRTTGERSQNSRIHGFCTSIGQQLGMDREKVYRALKALAVDEGYPVEWNAISETWEPKSQSVVSTEDASILIKVIQRYADEHHLWLIEYGTDGRPVKTLYGQEVKE